MVEYILLLIIGIAVATLVTRQMVSRDPNNPGFLITKWFQIDMAIGADQADDTN